jgi:copper chaperone
MLARASHGQDVGEDGGGSGGNRMSTRTVVGVSGMTCQHCVNAVKEEIGALAGVTDVQVELTPGATSTVTVTSDAAPDPDGIAAAVAEAGYAVVPPRSLL